MHKMTRAFCLMLILVVTGMANAGVPKSGKFDVERAHAQYHEAISERKRLQVAIDVMSAGLIQKWSSVKVVDLIFGSKFDSKRANLRPGHRTWGTIDFVDQPVSASDDEAAERVGWYMAVQFDSNGIVLDYYLSNSHK